MGIESAALPQEGGKKEKLSSNKDIINNIEKSIDYLEELLKQLPDEEKSKVQWLPFNIQSGIRMFRELDKKNEFSKEIKKLEERLEGIINHYELDRVALHLTTDVRK